MDIKNIFDFESKVELLISTDDQIKNDMKYQNKFMNSEIADFNFNKIENNLNTLYERIRSLEELIDYAKMYVGNEIDEVISDCRGLLNEIENMNDLSFNDAKNYTITNVPLINNDSAQYVDRDGSSLKTCEVYNNIISLSGTVKDNIEINTVTTKSTEQVYENNPDALVNGEPYRTHYLLDNVAKNGITETITLNFNGVKNINSIKVKLSNCKIDGIIYIHEDNTESYDSNTSTAKGIIPNRTVKAIKLLINANTYTPKTVVVNTTEANRFDSLESSWREVHTNIKEQDIISSTSDYQSTFCDYLDSLYLNKEA